MHKEKAFFVRVPLKHFYKMKVYCAFRRMKLNQAFMELIEDIKIPKRALSSSYKVPVRRRKKPETPVSPPAEAPLSQDHLDS